MHIASKYGKTQIAWELVKVSEDPCYYISLEDNEGLNAIVLSEMYRFPYLSELLRDLSSQASQKELLSHVKNIEYRDQNSSVPKHPLELENMSNNFFDVNVELRGLNETDLFWVDSQESLDKMIGYFQDIRVLGVDLEYHNFDIKKGCVCLVQISSGEKDFVIDLLSNRFNVGQYLQKLMIDPQKLKILHGSDSDLY